MRSALTFAIALSTVTASQAAPNAASSAEAQLCRSQLELLLSGNKLTAEEAARFEQQCDCLDDLADHDETADCAAARDDQ